MEAEQSDLQERIDVEAAWEALEQAGIPPQILQSSWVSTQTTTADCCLDICQISRL